MVGLCNANADYIFYTCLYIVSINTWPPEHACKLKYTVSPDDKLLV
jgi:hypothetical protein